MVVLVIIPWYDLPCLSNLEVNLKGINSLDRGLIGIGWHRVASRERGECGGETIRVCPKPPGATVWDSEQLTAEFPPLALNSRRVIQETTTTLIETSYIDTSVTQTSISHSSGASVHLKYPPLSKGPIGTPHCVLK